MLVPEVVAASTSPSPAKAPPVTETVAPTRPRLSMSLIATPGDSATGEPPSVNDAVAATPDSTGGSLTGTMLSVVVWGTDTLFDAVPSSTVHATVRVGSTP